MADLYLEVEELAAALQRGDARLEAADAVRGLIDSIALTPSPSRDVDSRDEGAHRPASGLAVARRLCNDAQDWIETESGRDVGCRPAAFARE